MAAILESTLKIYVPLNTFWYIFIILLPGDLEIRKKGFITIAFCVGCIHRMPGLHGVVRDTLSVIKRI